MQRRTPALVALAVALGCALVALAGCTKPATGGIGPDQLRLRADRLRDPVRERDVGRAELRRVRQDLRDRADLSERRVSVPVRPLELRRRLRLVRRHALRELHHGLSRRGRSATPGRAARAATWGRPRARRGLRGDERQRSAQLRRLRGRLPGRRDLQRGARAAARGPVRCSAPPGASTRTPAPRIAAAATTPARPARPAPTARARAAARPGRRAPAAERPGSRERRGRPAWRARRAARDRGGTGGAAGTSGAAGSSGAPGPPARRARPARRGRGPTGSRVDVNFDTDWRFNKADASGADAKAFADTSWGYVDLPHTAKFNTPDDITAYSGISWYRKHFTVAASYQGQQALHRVRRGDAARGRLGQRHAQGPHQGGYAPFTVDVTADVTTGGADNVIAVKLDSNANSNWPPGWPRVDFQYHGGLYRHVTMHVTNPLHVTDAVYANKVAGGGVFVTYPSASTTSAMVSIKTNVINESTASKSATVAVADPRHGRADGGDRPCRPRPSPRARTATSPRPSPSRTRSSGTRTRRCSTRSSPPSRTGARRWTACRRGSASGASRSPHSGGLVINGARFKALGVDLHEEIYGARQRDPGPVVLLRRQTDPGRRDDLHPRLALPALARVLRRLRRARRDGHGRADGLAVLQLRDRVRQRHLSRAARS